MDGKELLRRLRELLDEESSGTWISERVSYDFLWEAAIEYTRRTGKLTAEQAILTVSDQPHYSLNADFLRLYLTDSNHREYIEYHDGSSDHMITFKDYEDIVYSNYIKIKDVNTQTSALTKATDRFTDTAQDFSDWQTTGDTLAGYQLFVYDNDGRESYAYLGALADTTDDTAIYVHGAKSTTSSKGWVGGSSTGTAQRYEVRNVSSDNVPDHFAIRDKQALYSQITGTATSAGAASGGVCTLTDTSGLFLTTDYVSPGDHIHNTTDGSTGIVLSITSATALVCALFGGTDNDWSADDAYVIQPQGRVELYLDPPPSTSNRLIRIPYVPRPDPVYSDYGTYRFQYKAMTAIIKYAGWMYKYRDSEPNFGDKLFMWWDRQVRQDAAQLKPFLKQKRWGINLRRRS